MARSLSRPHGTLSLKIKTICFNWKEAICIGPSWRRKKTRKQERKANGITTLEGGNVENEQKVIYLIQQQGPHIVIYSKCTGFIVCLTYNDMLLSMYLNQW